jgi:hypothetical protein
MPGRGIAGAAVTHPPDIVALANHLVAICPCEWTPADRARMIVYLTERPAEAVADLPLIVERTGTFYRLRVRR